MVVVAVVWLVLLWQHFSCNYICYCCCCGCFLVGPCGDSGRGCVVVFVVAASAQGLKGRKQVLLLLFPDSGCNCGGVACVVVAIVFHVTI